MYTILFWVTIAAIILVTLGIIAITFEHLGLIEQEDNDNNANNSDFKDMAIGCITFVFLLVIAAFWLHGKQQNYRSTNPETLTQKIAISHIKRAAEGALGLNVKSVYFLEYNDLQSLLGNKKITQWDGLAEIYSVNEKDEIGCIIVSVGDTRKFGYTENIFDLETMRPCKESE